jgi:DNA repair exonuclease SbcCD ATPase subunit
MRGRRLIQLMVYLLAAGTASSAWAQSLADVARKEEERRKTQPQSAKVYTNKDLAPVPPSTVPSSTAPAPAAATNSPTDGKATTENQAKDAGDKDNAKTEAKGQAYWSGRRKALQDALDRDSTFAEALQSRINALTTDFVNRDDPAQRAIIERDRQKALAELERLKKQIIEDRKALADLEEEARRAGVPPGWLR